MEPESVRTHYQEDLERLESRGLDALDLVAEAIDRALLATRSHDTDLARVVIRDDDLIDSRYLELHQELIRLLATQAPVATDLRLIAALLHVMKHIERMGDQCVNIAKLVPVSGDEPSEDARILDAIETMGEQAKSLAGQAKSAFSNRDVEAARDLVRQDDVIDDLNRDCFTRAIEIGTDADRREWSMSMLLVARALERIGDNAVDIGEQVAFVVTGLFEEFEDASHPGEAGEA